MSHPTAPRTPRRSRWSALAAVLVTALVASAAVVGGAASATAAPVSYTVTYDANGGTGTTPSGTFTPGAETPYFLAVPGFTREGFRFLVWNTKVDGKGTDYWPGTPFNDPPSADVTFYAIWAAPLENGFDANGGQFTAPGVKRLTIPSSSMLAKCYFNVGGRSDTTTVTRAGYTLTGLNSARDGSGAYACTWGASSRGAPNTLTCDRARVR